MKHKPYLIYIFLIILLLSLPYSCGPTRKATGDVINIQKHPELSTYIISIDGYRSRIWSYSDIIVRIDPFVKAPQAIFSTEGTSPRNAWPITLIFQSREDAQRAMGS